jgi:hypothetical protein
VDYCEQHFAELREIAARGEHAMIAVTSRSRDVSSRA